MPLDTRHSVTTRNAKLNARTALFNGGFLRLYTGTRPANADTALSGNTLVAELTFSATAFGAASNGSATANAIGADTSADNSGTVTWARAFQSNGTTVIEDYSAGRNGYAADGTTVDAGAVYNVNLNSAVVGVGANVSASGMTLTEPAQGA